jgi:hypothetical protein
MVPDIERPDVGIMVLDDVLTGEDQALLLAVLEAADLAAQELGRSSRSRTRRRGESRSGEVARLLWARLRPLLPPPSDVSHRPRLPANGRALRGRGDSRRRPRHRSVPRTGCRVRPPADPRRPTRGSGSKARPAKRRHRRSRHQNPHPPLVSVPARPHAPPPALPCRPRTDVLRGRSPLKQALRGYLKPSRSWLHTRRTRAPGARSRIVEQAKMPIPGEISAGSVRSRGLVAHDVRRSRHNRWQHMSKAV